MDNQPSPKAQQAVAQVLAPGEQVRAWACGRYEGVTVVTDRRLYVYHCAPLAKPLMSSWPLISVIGISLEKGFDPFLWVDYLGNSSKAKWSNPNSMNVSRASGPSTYGQVEQDIQKLLSAVAAGREVALAAGEKVDAGPMGEELANLTQAWTLPAIIRTYEGDDAGRRLLAAEVQVLGLHGYSPAGQDEAAGHHEAGRVLLKGTAVVLFGVVPGMTVGTKSKGAITVAFQKIQVPPPAPSAADPIEQLRKVGELRDAGGLTESEFQAKKAELMARF